MGSSSAPKTPDYTQTAIQQGANDLALAKYTTAQNRVNQTDPYGSTTWGTAPVTDVQRAGAYQDLLSQYQADIADGNKNDEASKIWAQMAAGGNYGLTGSPQQTTVLNPQQQALLNQQVGIQGQQNSRISGLLNTFQTPTLAATPTLQKANPNDVSNLLYSQATHNLDKRFATDEASTRASLANQGFQQGSEGYNNTLNDFNTNKNDTYQQAQTAASLGGYSQANAENAQNLQNYNAVRGGNLNDYNSQMGFLSQLLGGVQGPTNPQYPSFAPATTSQSPDLTGAQQATYQGNLNQTNAQNASRSNTLGTVGTLASAAAIAY